MKHFFLLFCLLLSIGEIAQSQPDIQGEWQGYVDIQGQRLPIQLIFTAAAQELDGSIDIPQQNAFNLPVDVPHISEDSLVFQFETGTGPGVFRADLDSDNPQEINGEFEQNGMKFPFSIRTASGDTIEVDGKEQEIIIETGSHQIAGSLITPSSSRDSTLVIFVNGSGSQDRNSTVADFKVFGRLAQLMAENGYFSFRYDDRGVGRSTGNADATLQELAVDLSAVISHFDDMNSIFLLGHSQGGIVAALAAERESIDGLILMAAPFLSGDEIITQQIQKIADVQNIPKEVVEQNLEFQQQVYQAVRNESGWEELEDNLQERLQEQIDELPEKQKETLGDMDQFIQNQVDRQLEGARTRWFKSFIELDPRPVLYELDLPVLALFGERDVQVLHEPNIKALKRQEMEIMIRIIESANHLFQKSESGMPDEYGILENDFADGFYQEITDWLDQQSQDQ